jgi:HEPN domain-containing protein
MRRMKKYTRQDGFSELSLLHAAADHLGSAKALFERNPRCFDSAGYLCHLGAELVLKAMLLEICDEFPNEHSLIKLSELIQKQNTKMNYDKHHLYTVTMLDGFNDLRYPNPSGPIEVGDDDWEKIENLFDFLIFMLPERIQDEFKKLDHSVKDDRILMKKRKKKGI